MSKERLYFASTKGIYFLTGAFLVAQLYDKVLAEKFFVLIMLFGGIIIGIMVTEKEKEK